MSIRILVVEDEPLLAFDIAQHLTTAGYEVVGPASTVARALELIASQGCDIAVLDINLGHETAEPIAAVLTGRGAPFFTVTGYSRDQHPPAFQGVPSLTKPITPEDLLALVRRLSPGAA